jgi:hypothetical protein
VPTGAVGVLGLIDTDHDSVRQRAVLAADGQPKSLRAFQPAKNMLSPSASSISIPAF